MNTVILTGRLTRDPQLSRGKSDTAYCKFNLAVDRGKNKNGEKETDFPTIIAFGKTAENLAKYTEQGNLIGVEGEIRTSKYEKDGKTIYNQDIFAGRIEFLQWKKKDGDSAPDVAEPDADEAADTDDAPAGYEKTDEAPPIFTDDNTPF